MTRSRKKIAIATNCCCKSQKKGKQAANRKFRRRARTELASGREEHVPLKSIELTDPWDLGGDGKSYYEVSELEDARLYRSIMGK